VSRHPIRDQIVRALAGDDLHVVCYFHRLKHCYDSDERDRHTSQIVSQGRLRLSLP
jgi:hypothetical protein